MWRPSFSELKFFNTKMFISTGATSFEESNLYQGDIVLDLQTRLQLQGGQNRGKRAVKKLNTARWPNGEIPYVVDRELGKVKENCLFSELTRCHIRFASSSLKY